MTQASPYEILVVDDTPANIQLLAGMLTKVGYSVRPTTNGQHALEAARSAPPDLVLLDIRMPEMDGYAVCSQLKADPNLYDVPVIFISALDDTEDKLRAFEVGGVDYITKPFRNAEVLARVATHLALRQRQRDIEALQNERIRHLEEIAHLKDDVLRMVSHDLKNPLSNIMAGSEFLSILLADQPGITKKADNYLGYINRGAAKMRDLLNDVLDLATAEGDHSQSFEPISLTRYLEIALKEIAPSAESKSITLQFAPPTPDLVVPLMPTRFEHVLQNLLSNAIKYNNEGGLVELGAEQQGDQVVIWVKDNGIGIPAEAQANIFDKFYRVNHPNHRLQTGSGLGMAIVKAIVDQHGGQVTVESQLNEGSVFRVYLPLTP